MTTAFAAQGGTELTATTIHSRGIRAIGHAARRFGVISFVLVSLYTGSPAFAEAGANIRLFTDAVFQNDNRPAQYSAFQLGQLVLMGSGQIADDWRGFFELAFKQNSDNSLTTDVERAIVSYDHSDLLRVTLGRYHTAIGYWNNAYHHGSWLQPSIDRPDVVAFASPFIPVHIIGLELYGRKKATEGVFEYLFNVGNGVAFNRATNQTSSDNNDNKAINGHVRFKDFFVPGLAVGGNLYYDEADSSASVALAATVDGVRNAFPNGAVQTRMQRKISGVHALYMAGPYEFIAEWYNIRNKYRNNANYPLRYENKAYFLHFAYQLDAKLKPYVQYERKNVNEADPYFFVYQNLVDERVIHGGIRYDVTAFATIKMECIRHELDVTNRFDYNLLRAQVAYTF